MAKTSPLQFIQQVRQEVSKVTWPTRKETMVTTLMVFIMVLMMAMFFFTLDLGLGAVVNLLLHFPEVLQYLHNLFQQMLG